MMTGRVIKAVYLIKAQLERLLKQRSSLHDQVAA